MLTSENKTSNPPTCPKCGKQLLKIYYTEYGVKQWISNEWQEVDDGDSEWRTGCCDEKLNFDDLQELLVF